MSNNPNNGQGLFTPFKRVVNGVLSDALDASGNPMMLDFAELMRASANNIGQQNPGPRAQQVHHSTIRARTTRYTTAMAGVPFKPASTLEFIFHAVATGPPTTGAVLDALVQTAPQVASRVQSKLEALASRTELPIDISSDDLWTTMTKIHDIRDPNWPASAQLIQWRGRKAALIRGVGAATQNSVHAWLEDIKQHKRVERFMQAVQTANDQLTPANTMRTSMRDNITLTVADVIAEWTTPQLQLSLHQFLQSHFQQQPAQIEDLVRVLTALEAEQNRFQTRILDVQQSVRVQSMNMGGNPNRAVSFLEDAPSMHARENRKRECYQFRDTGTCSYGDSCMFEHMQTGRRRAPTPGRRVFESRSRSRSNPRYERGRSRSREFGRDENRRRAWSHDRQHQRARSYERPVRDQDEQSGSVRREPGARRGEWSHREERDRSPGRRETTYDRSRSREMRSGPREAGTDSALSPGVKFYKVVTTRVEDEKATQERKEDGPTQETAVVLQE